MQKIRSPRSAKNCNKACCDFYPKDKEMKGDTGDKRKGEKLWLDPSIHRFWLWLGCCAVRILSLCSLIFSWKHTLDFEGLHWFHVLRVKTWFFPAVLAEGWQPWSIFDVTCTALPLCPLKAMNSTIFQRPAQAISLLYCLQVPDIPETANS